MKRKATLLGIKLGIALLLLGGLFYFADGERLLAEMRKVDPTFFWLAVLLQLVAFALGALRWWFILRRLAGQVPLATALPSYFLGLFANNFLPTSVGGDAVRTTHLHFQGYNARALVSSALIDRAIGVAAVLMLGGVAYGLSPLFTPAGGWTLLLLFSLATVVLFLLLSPPVERWLTTFAERHHQRRLLRFLADIALLCHGFRDSLGLLLGMLVLSLVLQSTVILVYALLGRGIGIDLPLTLYFIAVPLVTLVTSLPISVGGLGVREGALVALLVYFGTEYPPAVSLSLIYLLVLWLATLPGGLFLDRLGKVQTSPETTVAEGTGVTPQGAMTASRLK